MDKFLKILDLLIKLWQTFFPKKDKIVNTKDENIQVIKSALNSVEQTEDVVSAKKTIEYIETLPDKERTDKQEEIIEAKKIAEEKAKAKPISRKRTDRIIERYKNRRNS